MKELSKEDQERIHKEAVVHSISAIKNVDGIMGEMLARIEVISFRTGAEYEHPIAFEKGKIEGFNEGSASRQKEIDELKESLKQEKESHNSTYILMLSGESRGVEKGKIEGFNEGIEAVKMLFNPMFQIHPDSRNIIMIIESLKKAFEEIDKLKKKVSNEKGTV